MRISRRAFVLALTLAAAPAAQKYGFVQRVMSAFRMREPTVLRLCSNQAP